VYDLTKTMNIGRDLFNNFPFKTNSFVKFVDCASEAGKVDIVYFGSSLQYFSDYKSIILSIIENSPKYIFMTDNFMSESASYATLQVNMPNREIPYWIIGLNEIVSLLDANGYLLLYRSTNFQPFHNFHNFPYKNQVKDSCNLLFKLKDG
jgi:putative methyltransferase (TIGR04325 family)